MVYDLAIIGGGPAGCRAAEMAAGEGMSVILFESKRFGGHTIQESFISMQVLLDMVALSDHMRATPLSHPIRSLTPLGHKLSVSLVVDAALKASNLAKQRLQAHDVNILEGDATLGFIEKNLFCVHVGEEKVLAKRVILATGTLPILPLPLGRRQQSEIFSFSEILQRGTPPSSLVIWGGGLRALQMAAYLSHVGTKVTIVEQRGQASRMLDRMVADCFVSYLKEHDVRFLFGHTLESMERDSVTCSYEAGRVTVETEGVLVGDLRSSALRGLGLSELGLDARQLGRTCGPDGTTECPNLYIAGEADVRCQSLYTAVRQAEACVDHIMGRKTQVHHEAMPGTVPVAGELAWVGAPAHALKNTPFSQVFLPMPLSHGRQGGWCRLFANSHTGALVGAHMRGDGVSPMAYHLTTAMQAGLSPAETRRIIPPCSSASEVLCDALTQLQQSIRREISPQMVV